MSNTKDNTTEVLIVGAGPTGLMMACQLALRSIPFRIIDKKDHSTNYSGALILQARTVEIFQQMGIAQTAIQKGIIAREIRIVFNGKKAFTIPIINIGEDLTEFPYLLLLEQSKTEQLLIDFIGNYGYTVDWKTELLRFTQDTECVTAILNLSNGKTEIMKAKYLIAADGGHSTVREQLAIPFIGSTHDLSLFVTDCKARVNVTSDTICFLFSKEATAGFFPLKDGRWRVDGNIPPELEAKEKLTFDDIAENLAERIRMKVEFDQSQWFSVFHSHQRFSFSFRQNRCFLAGDAAHIHSPVGAQGMNTGIQDAFNLAWKLALIIQKKAKELLLESYASEREPIAKNVIRSTDKVFLLVTSRHYLIRWFRIHIIPFILQLILPALTRQKGIRHFLFRKISEIGVHYRESPLSQFATYGNFPAQAPKPGDRLPYILYSKDGTTVNTYEKVKGTGYHLLIFTDHSFDDVLRLAESYKHLISFETIPLTSETILLYERLGITKGGYYLIRPDMYIAYRSDEPEVEHLKLYLQRGF